MTPINNDIPMDKPGETKAVTRDAKISGVRRRIRFAPSDTMTPIPEAKTRANFEVSGIFKIPLRKKKPSDT
jgi:hypothetical protein